MTNTLEQMLEKLHSAVASDLLLRIESGQATAAEFAVAIKFLKDNGIDAHMTRDSPLENLAKTLPFEDPSAPIRSVG